MNYHDANYRCPAGEKEGKLHLLAHMLTKFKTYDFSTVFCLPNNAQLLADTTMYSAAFGYFHG